MIELQDVHKTYRLGNTQVRALRGVTLAISEREFVAIMGPSGSGKSTLMNIIGCLDRPDKGTYLLDATDVSRLSDDSLAEIRSKKIGFVFQTFNLLPRLDALRNVELPMIYNGTPGRRERALRALTTVGLADRVRHRPSELSGGEQQRVAVARALVNEPRLLLADEPTGNLDSATGAEIMALFQRLNESGITIILVSHDREVALRSRRIVHFRDGQITGQETVSPPPPSST
jgi:putative ABC transport system ATP-binding protein